MALGLAVLPVPGAGAEAPDEVLWRTIGETGYLELYRYFVATFPDSRHIEDARLRIEILTGAYTPPAGPIAAEPVREAQPAAIVPALDPRRLDVAAFQTALRARGCNGGIADGIWGERTAAAAQRFADGLGVDIDPSRPNVALFAAVFSAEGDICGEI